MRRREHARHLARNLGRRNRPARERVGYRAGQRSRSELLAVPGLGRWELPAIVGQASGLHPAGRPRDRGVVRGAFRRSEDFELFGRQRGAKCCDRLLQSVGRNSAFGKIVGQSLLEGEGIGLAAWTCRIGAFRFRPAGPAGAVIMPWRRQHGLQRAGVVAPGIELLGCGCRRGSRARPAGPPA